jgi:hypothetical protein
MIVPLFVASLEVSKPSIHAIYFLAQLIEPHIGTVDNEAAHKVPQYCDQSHGPSWIVLD